MPITANAATDSFVIDTSSPYQGTTVVAVNTNLTTKKTTGKLPTVSSMETNNYEDYSDLSNVMDIDKNGNYIYEPAAFLPELVL